MRSVLLSMSMVVLVLVTLWYLGDHDSENEANQQAAINPSRVIEGELPITESQPPQEIAVRSPSVQTHAAESIAMAPPNIKLLPLAQQQEIKQLSGRDNPNPNINEVHPGVFLMTDGPKVVPVAVVNADGSVTIHEY